MIEDCLRHCRILITRPTEQATALIDAIALLGGQAIHQPLYEIDYLPQHPSHQQVLAQLSDFHYAIFTSAYAAHASCPHWQTLPLHLQIIAVGSGTRQALSQYFQQPIILPEHSNSEGLLNLSILQVVKNKKIAIFCGLNPRDLLSKALIQRQAKVSVAICYRRVPISLRALDIASLYQASLDYIVITSGENVQSFFALLSNAPLAWRQKVSVVVISQRLQHLIQQFGSFIGSFKSILIADGASHRAIIECIKKDWCLF